MKTSTAVKSQNKGELIIGIISSIPDNEEEQRGDVEGQEINKDPIIGGADDVYRENPTNDLADSGLVDAEPLREDVNREPDRTGQTGGEQEEKEPNTPSDSEEENLKISNLDDNEDLTDDYS